MPAPFAALEAKVNDAVLRHHSNVMISIDMADPVQGIFDESVVDAFNVVVINEPSVLVDGSISVMRRAMVSLEDGREFSVIDSRVESGMMRLILKAI